MGRQGGDTRYQFDSVTLSCGRPALKGLGSSPHAPIPGIWGPLLPRDLLVSSGEDLRPTSSSFLPLAAPCSRLGAPISSQLHPVFTLTSPSLPFPTEPQGHLGFPGHWALGIAAISRGIPRARRWHLMQILGFVGQLLRRH